MGLHPCQESARLRGQASVIRKLLTLSATLNVSPSEMLRIQWCSVAGETEEQFQNTLSVLKGEHTTSEASHVLQKV